jgi:serine protease Do
MVSVKFSPGSSLAVKSCRVLLAFSLAWVALTPMQAPALARLPGGGAGPQTFYPTLIADVAEMVAPSVVSVNVERTARLSAPDFSGLPFGDELMKRFFGADGNNNPFTPFGGGGAGSSGQRTITGNGSGVVLSKEGYILTNNHVIASVDKVTITLNDGRQFPARLVGRDTYSDVAVLKIEAPSNLTPISLGDSDKLRPGEWVLAIGSPLGYDHTVTQGIVSALSRKIPDLNSNVSFIQTDAAINPGNSGGPLVNLRGEVIGINTAISGRGQNIGFAIPINSVKLIANTLIAGKPVVRPWIGLSMVGLNPDLAQHVGLPPNTQGVMVAQVMQNSPAYQAGLMQSDVIQKVDGKAVTQPEAVQAMIHAKPLNATLILNVLRNGHPMEVKVVTQPLPESSESLVPSHLLVKPRLPGP